LAFDVENGGANRNASLLQALPCFVERPRKHCFVAGSRQFQGSSLRMFLWRVWNRENKMKRPL
jgi:hypothetical protein